MSDDGRMTDGNIWLAGVDGCPGGWLAVFVRPAGDDVRVRVIPRFADISDAPEQPAVIAVDMPIGLPDISPPKGRAAECEARSRLGGRKSSVFRIPSRAAVGASLAAEPADPRERFLNACRIARETSEDKKAFSKQSFYILHKVAEVDAHLRSRPMEQTRVFEVHPELAFWRLNGECALDQPKKVKSRLHPPGAIQRRALLHKAGFPRAYVEATPPRGAAEDDLLDALACAAIARRIHAGTARPFPNPPPRDAYGLPMAIWA
jgi:predicted RNase H-like nuclease